VVRWWCPIDLPLSALVELQYVRLEAHFATYSIQRSVTHVFDFLRRDLQILEFQLPLVVMVLQWLLLLVRFLQELVLLDSSHVDYLELVEIF